MRAIAIQDPGEPWIEPTAYGDVFCLRYFQEDGIWWVPQYVLAPSGRKVPVRPYEDFLEPDSPSELHALLVQVAERTLKNN